MDKIISVDIETSTGNIHNATILSIAMVRLDGMGYLYEEVHHPDGFFVDPKAIMVNQMDFNALGNPDNLTLAALDENLAMWLEDDSIMMGWRISGFDAPIIQRCLPKTFKKFFKYHLDLAPFLLALAIDMEKPMKELRDAAFKFAEIWTADYMEQVGLHNLDPHNALYDAFHNVGVYKRITMRKEKA